MTSLVVVGIGILAISAGLWAWSRYLRWCTKRKRPGWGLHQFAKQLQDVKDAGLIATTYAYFQALEGDSSFPVSATDAVGGYYGLADEDLEEAVCELATLCGRDQPPKEEVYSVQVVADVVRLLAGLQPVRAAEVPSSDELE